MVWRTDDPPKAMSSGPNLDILWTILTKPISVYCASWPVANWSILIYSCCVRIYLRHLTTLPGSHTLLHSSFQSLLGLPNSNACNGSRCRHLCSVDPFLCRSQIGHSWVHIESGSTFEFIWCTHSIDISWQWFALYHALFYLPSHALRCSSFLSLLSPKILYLIMELSYVIPVLKRAHRKENLTGEHLNPKRAFIKALSIQQTTELMIY